MSNLLWFSLESEVLGVYDTTVTSLIANDLNYCVFIPISIVLYNVKGGFTFTIPLSIYCTLYDAHVVKSHCKERMAMRHIV